MYTHVQSSAPCKCLHGDGDEVVEEHDEGQPALDERRAVRAPAHPTADTQASARSFSQRVLC